MLTFDRRVFCIVVKYVTCGVTVYESDFSFYLLPERPKLCFTSKSCFHKYKIYKITIFNYKSQH